MSTYAKPSRARKYDKKEWIKSMHTLPADCTALIEAIEKITGTNKPEVEPIKTEIYANSSNQISMQ